MPITSGHLPIIVWLLIPLLITAGLLQFNYIQFFYTVAMPENADPAIFFIDEMTCNFF